VSFGLRRLLLRESIYTMKLARRGHYIPEALQANAHLVHHVADVALVPVEILNWTTSPDALDATGDGPSYFVLMEGPRVMGVITREWALGHPRELHEARSLADVARTDYVTVEPDTTIFDVMANMQAGQAELAVVLAPVKERKAGHAPIRGVLTGAHLAEVIAEGMEYFAS
jgi:CIC family chloride channel protein